MQSSLPDESSRVETSRAESDQTLVPVHVYALEQVSRQASKRAEGQQEVVRFMLHCET